MLKRLWMLLTKSGKHGGKQENVTFSTLKQRYGYERQELIGWNAADAAHTHYAHLYDTSARIH